jgi:hypothetical protein
MAKRTPVQPIEDEAGSSRPARPRSKRVLNAEGRIEVVYTFDVAKPDWVLEFDAIFQRNVDRVRREGEKVRKAAVERRG